MADRPGYDWDAPLPGEEVAAGGYDWDAPLPSEQPEFDPMAYAVDDGVVGAPGISGLPSPPPVAPEPWAQAEAQGFEGQFRPLEKMTTAAEEPDPWQRTKANFLPSALNIMPGLGDMAERGGRALMFPGSPEADEQLAGVGAELGHLGVEMVRKPVQMLEGAGLGSVPYVGQLLEQYGWTYEDWLREFPDDPAGSTLLTMAPFLHGARKANKPPKPPSGGAPLTELPRQRTGPLARETALEFPRPSDATIPEKFWDRRIESEPPKTVSPAELPQKGEPLPAPPEAPPATPVEAPVAPEAPAPFMAGSRVRGKGAAKWWIIEELPQEGGGLKYRVSKNKSGRGRHANNQVLDASELRPLEEKVRTEPKKDSRAAMPDREHLTPQAARDYIARHGGIVLEDYGFLREIDRQPGLEKKPGAKNSEGMVQGLDYWGEAFAEGPFRGEGKEAARAWIEENLTKRADEPGARSGVWDDAAERARFEEQQAAEAFEGEIQTAEVREKAQREKFGMKTTEIADPDATSRNAMEFPEGTVEAIKEGSLKPGEAVYVPEKADVYRVKENKRQKPGEADVILQDGDQIRLKKGEAVDAVRMGEVGEAPGGLPERAGRIAKVREGKGKPQTGIEGSGAVPSRTAPDAALPGMKKERAAIEDAAKQREGKEAAVAEAEATGQTGMFDDVGGDAKAAAAARAAEQAGKAREADAPALFTPEETGAGKLALERETKKVEGYGAKNRIVTKDRLDKAIKSFHKKSTKLSAGIDPTAVKELVEIAVYHAEALAHASAKGAADFAKWSKRVIESAKDLYGKKYELAESDLHRLWNNGTVRLARDVPQNTPLTAARAQGRLERWRRQTAQGTKLESKAQVGEKAFSDVRRTDERLRHGLAVIEKRFKKMFKGLSAPARDAMTVTLRGISDQGNYGSIQRAGTRRVPENYQRLVEQGEIEAPGMLDPKGRVVGQLIEGSRSQQLYRIIWPEDAAKAYESLKKDHPKAAEVVDAILAESESPIYTVGGDRIPSLSRAEMKETYAVEGLTVAEAKDASALARKAFGQDARAEFTPQEFSYIPESGEIGNTRMARVRNSLRETKASVRELKTGEVYEKTLEEGREVDLQHGLTKTHMELFREQMHNDMAARVLALLAEPVKKGSKPKPGYDYFTASGLKYGETKKFRRFLDQHREYFEGLNIDIENAKDASSRAEGTLYQIPEKIGRDLGEFFAEKAKDADPGFQRKVEMADRIAGDLVSMITATWLGRFSTANRNALGQLAVYAPKVLAEGFRVFTDAAFRESSGAHIEFLADLRAMGTAFGKKSRGRIPKEYLSNTLYSEVIGGRESLATLVPGAVLRATGFQFWDIHFKRVVREAVHDGWARKEWVDAKKRGEIKDTSRKAKQEWLDNKKKNLPKEIEQLAYREMDAHAFDYGNTGAGIETVKKSKFGRSIIPYPTFFYKLFNHAREYLPGPHNMKILVSKKSTRAQKSKVLANLLAGATMTKILWELIDEDGNLATDAKDPEVRKMVKLAQEATGRTPKEADLPYSVQQFGFSEIPGTRGAEWLNHDENEASYVRLYDIPWVGDIMAYKAIMGGGVLKGNITPFDYFRDRVALGPLANAIFIFAGLSTKFDKDIPEASRWGRQFASWTPLSPQLLTIRRLIDPTKRESGREGEPALRNFYSGLIEQYPGMSGLLRERVSSGTISLPRYARAETLMSQFLLNVKTINDKERDAAIALAYVANLEDVRTQEKRDRLRKHIRAVMDYEGKTLAGYLKSVGRTDLQELNLRVDRTALALEVDRAFDVGGEDHAAQVAAERIAAAEPYKKKSLEASALAIMRNRVTLRDHGLVGKVLREAPKRQRRMLHELIKEIGRRGVSKDRPYDQYEESMNEIRRRQADGWVDK